MSRKSGILGGQMVLPAGRTADGVSLRGAPDQLFEFCAAIVTRILKYGHALKLPSGQTKIS